MLACVLAVAAIVVGAFVTPDGANERALLDRIDPARGMLCAVSIFVLSLPIVALLGALMRRAAPTQPRLSALASGIAAGACGAFVFAFCCPFNDPLYVVVWYSVGCAAVAEQMGGLLPGLAGMAAILVQVLVYFLVRRLLPQLNAHIPEDKAGPAILLAAMSLAAGIINAACLTY
jgi:hypothetical protein